MVAQANDAPRPVPAEQEPITPVPDPPKADPRKLGLGQRLFVDRRLSHDGSLACISCHDIHTNGSDGGLQRRTGFATLSVFNAALSFRFNWEGKFRTLEAQTRALLENPAIMATTTREIVTKLSADLVTVRQFREAYGRDPDEASLLDALTTYERSLLTPGSRFDRWLLGDAAALSEPEQEGYRLFKSLGCISCHQGVNIGGNLFERPGIFHPLASTQPPLLRVPSLRNIAVIGPYFHDGSAATLEDAVHRMASAQLDRILTDQQVASIVSFLGTLTGNFRGAPVVAPSP